MAFDWNGYLTFAKSLQTETAGRPSNVDVEAKRRSAISRAYYAVYHIAEDYAKANLGYVVSKGGPNQHHSNVRSVYQSQLGNPDHQEVRKMLARLHKVRVQSDYHPDGLGNIESQLASVIIDADRINSILSR